MVRDGATIALGAALRQARIARGVSLRALARQVGLSGHGTLLDYEHGRRIPPKDLLAACERVLAVPDGDLQRLRDAALAARGDREAGMLMATVYPAHPGQQDGGEGLPRRRSPRQDLIVTGGVLLASAIALMVTIGLRHPAPVRPASATPPTEPTVAGRPADGADPYVMGCGADQKELERRLISWPDGSPYGQVVLFHSHACNASWGYVYGPNSTNWTVHIRPRRLTDDVTAPFAFSDATRPNSWSNLLSTRTGCVLVQAWITQGGRNSAVAETSCVQDGGRVVRGSS